MSQLLHSPHEAAIINALQWQGNTNDCAPYTVATILSAFSGSVIDGSELAKQMNKPVWRGLLLVIRRIPNWATFPWGIVDVLREYGYPAHWGIRYKPDFLRASIQKGNIPLPILGSWQPISAHVMALIAWNPTGFWGFANTQYNVHQIHWMPDNQFIKQWNLTTRMLIEVNFS